MAAGISDYVPIRFIEDSDYDEAFGPDDPPGFLDKVRADIAKALRKNNDEERKR